MNGPLSNIHDDGFAAASFHSWPETLAWDAYSGDYGPNFVGLTLGSASYLVEDPDLGLVAYGGTVVSSSDDAVSMQPRDAIRKKVFVGPLGITIEVNAGVVQEVVYAGGNGTVSVTLAQLDGVPKAAAAIMWVSTEAGSSTYTVTGPNVTEAKLGWQIPLDSGSVTVDVAA